MEGGRSPALAAYLSVIESGARRYLAHLREQLTHAPRSPRGLALREVARPLAQTLEHVLRTRQLAPGDLPIPNTPFTRGSGHPELLNPWSVGLGNPAAPLWMVGPEPVYTLDSPEFLLEGLLLQALWLADADVHAAASALPCPAWSEVPFQRYPNDFYRNPSSSTWGRLASLLSLAWGGTPRDLLQPKRVEDNAAPHLFDDAYLLELSTVPESWRSTAAPTPIAEREAFLGELLTSVPGARMLFFPGQPDDTEWTAVQLRLAARFLGVSLQDVMACLQTERPTRTRDELRWFLHGDRGILLSVRLSHEVEDGYWERAAELIRMLMPERPPPPG